VRADKKLSSAFGTVLRKRRREVGISQEGLALSAEVDRTFVSQIERGVRQPTLTTIWKLAGALQTQPSILIKKTERIVSTG
jgi:transcriptional regulator with XRE-family HTH domain